MLSHLQISCVLHNKGMLNLLLRRDKAKINPASNLRIFR